MANPFYVQPADMSRGFGMAMEGITSGAQFKMKRAEEEKKQAKRQEASDLMQSGNLDELSTMMVKNPWLIDSVDKAMNWKNEETKQNALDAAKDILIEGVPPATALINRAEFVIQQGGDASGTMQLAEQAQQDPQAAIQESERVLALYDPAALKQYRKLQGKGEDEELTSAQKEFNSLTENLKPADVLLAKRISLGLDPRAVGSAVQTITEKGTAEEIADTEAVIAERKKFAEMTGSSRSRAIDKGFDKVQKLTKNIRNLDDAISAVEAGAGTGAITKRFPSIRGSSVLLDQVQGNLALDVIGSVTFGALSEGELALAKQIAIPTGLEGPELIKWLQDRKSAQTKLLGYFQDQINFLDQGGSVAGFLRSKRREISQIDQLPQGVTEEDITATMQANNMTREQVLARLRGQ